MVYGSPSLVNALVSGGLPPPLPPLPGYTSASYPGKPTGTETSPPPSPSAVKPCAVSNIEVKGMTDATSYARGVDPMLSLSIQNTGSKACSFSVGPDVQKYVITSGSDTIWTSTDCQATSAPLDKILEPGAALTTQPISWDRARSNPATCSVTNPKQVIAGGASYHLTASVNGVTSSTANSPQFVLR